MVSVDGCCVACSLSVVRVDVSIVLENVRACVPASHPVIRLLPNVEHLDVLSSVPLCVGDAHGETEYSERHCD